MTLRDIYSSFMMRFTRARTMMWLTAAGGGLAIADHDFAKVLWTFSAFIGWTCYYKASADLQRLLDHIEKMSRSTK